MGKIILIVGPHGVGKTSLFEYAKKIGEFDVHDGFQFSQNGFDLSQKKDFIEYQKQYFDKISEQNYLIKEGNKDGLVIRSIEESSFYYYSHPHKNEVIKDYFDHLEKSYAIMADLIIYLDAKMDVLQSRYFNDNNRDIQETLEWYKNKYGIYDSYWKKFPGVFFLDTSDLGVDEVYQEVKRLSTIKKDEYLKGNEYRAMFYEKYVINGLVGYYKYNENVVKGVSVIGLPNKHVYGGYYDIQQISNNGENMIIMVVDQNASPSKDEAEVCIYNLFTQEITPVTKTRAWCWQQGCRARWIDNNTILINNEKDGKYISEVWDILKQQKICEYSKAFYDVFKDDNNSIRYGLALDFSRLQTMRPGYGYSWIADISASIHAPNDGIQKFDFSTGTISDIIDIKELSKEVNSNEYDYHYINHISISPDGKKFMFFHVWAPDNRTMWKMRLMVMDLIKGKYICLDNENIISHYCWIDDDKLLVTILKNGEHCFYVYNLHNCERVIIENDSLIQDGHPTLLKERDAIMVDTYPLKNCIQKIFKASLFKNSYEEIFQVFSDPRMFIERRCDLHPRITPNNKIITMDSTFIDGVRKVIILWLK